MAYNDIAIGAGLLSDVRGRMRSKSDLVKSSERLYAPLYRRLVQAVVEFLGFVEN